jgi:hypothetical protein
MLCSSKRLDRERPYDWVAGVEPMAASGRSLPFSVRRLPTQNSQATLLGEAEQYAGRKNWNRPYKDAKGFESFQWNSKNDVPNYIENHALFLMLLMCKH